MAISSEFRFGSDRSKSGATIKDVAEHVGVSVMTVSRAINGGNGVAPGTKAAVDAAIREIGYSLNYDAWRLAAKRPMRVAFLGDQRVRAWPDDLMLACVRYAAQHGIDLLLESSDGPIDHRGAAQLQRLGVRGILVPPNWDSRQVLKGIAKTGILRARMAASEFDGVCSSVGLKEMRSCEELVKSLGMSGYTHLGLLGGVVAELAGADRLKSFLATSGKKSLRLNVRAVGAKRGSFSDFYTAALEMLAEKVRPPRVVVANDESAIAVVAASARLGIVLGGRASSLSPQCGRAHLGNTRSGIDLLASCRRRGLRHRTGAREAGPIRT